ncbi:hypothetical protein CRYUN_Cryun21dG0011200 [Craigia yunnanensis]
MEENRFSYIPPRVMLKRLDYLHYVRKKDEGAMTYVAHADYYILLRSCARVAEVDMRSTEYGEEISLVGKKNRSLLAFNSS